MGTITQEVNVDLVEKLIDGNFKIKYPKTTAAQVKDLNIEVVSLALTKVVCGTHTPDSDNKTYTVLLGFTPKVVFCYRQSGTSSATVNGTTIIENGFTYNTSSNNGTQTRTYYAWA